MNETNQRYQRHCCSSIKAISLSPEKMVIILQEWSGMEEWNENESVVVRIVVRNDDDNDDHPKHTVADCGWTGNVESFSLFVCVWSKYWISSSEIILLFTLPNQNHCSVRLWSGRITTTTTPSSSSSSSTKETHSHGKRWGTVCVCFIINLDSELLLVFIRKSSFAQSNIMRVYVPVSVCVCVRDSEIFSIRI